MFRSKSRSGSFDFGKKNRQSSVLSRTLSASKFCRGDPLISQIDANALKPVEQKPSKIVNLSENQIVKISRMQQHMGEQLEEELRMARDQLGTAKEERDRAIDELREMKMATREANMKLSEALSNSTKELKAKERYIESLRLKLEKAKEIEERLAQRDESFDTLKEELSNAEASEAQTMGLVMESKQVIQELEGEIERGKMSETRMYNTLASQTKQLEETKIELEESKLHVSSLREKIEKVCNHENSDSMKEEIESLRFELQLAKENLRRAQEGEEIATSKAEKLLEEMNLHKGELKLAIDAEEKSKKAMDDLALALTEVATEANQAKEKLSLTEVELDHVKEETEQLKGMVRSSEERYQKKLEELEKEKERYKNTVERLRLEAEESLLAWNDKEIEFVNCIKTGDEEKALAQKENNRLIESLKAAENIARTSREENFKLRDILKQALNEANVAKEAAGIAREENSQLKDSHSEKDEALDYLTRENERLRINEAAANESIKELKRLLSMSSKKEVKSEDGKKLNKAFSFDLSELTFPNEVEDLNETIEDDHEEDPIKAEALKGSIFDNVDSPKSEPHTPLHRRVSSSFTDDGEMIISEDLDHLDGSHFGDEEHERNSQRKSRALLRRFGDLIKRKSTVKKEPPSVE